jgi:[acyl-carrier-protein] S-malonyltransferase
MTSKFAFLFPGQGSQAVGMGADIFAASEAARRVFTTVDAALDTELSSLCFNGPEDALRATINAQPAIATVSLALLAAFQEALSPSDSTWSSPLTPALIAGHSVGECTTLVAAGVLDLSDAARFIRERGRLMNQEGTLCPGGMAAIIGMDAATLQEICQQATEQVLAALPATGATHPGQGRVIVANYNAPGQIVISGEQNALDLACNLARERGAKRVIPLAVSGAFHSPVMQPAADVLAQTLQTLPLRDAAIPVVSNITALPLALASDFRTELAQQVASSVQWISSIEEMVNQGVEVFIEIGPGQALTGMIKRIARGVTLLNIGTAAEVTSVAARVCDMGLL